MVRGKGTAGGREGGRGQCSAARADAAHVVFVEDREAPDVEAVGDLLRQGEFLEVYELRGVDGLQGQEVTKRKRGGHQMALRVALFRPCLVSCLSDRQKQRRRRGSRRDLDEVLAEAERI